jgi:hypothetical protein
LKGEPCMASKPASASLAERCLSVAWYFGLAPFLRSWRPIASNAFIDHHYAQAMAAAFVALVWLFVDAVVEAGETLFLIHFPDSARTFINQWEPYLTYAMLLPLVVVAGLWMGSVGLALAGSTRPMLLLKRIARKPQLVRVGFGANSFALALVLIVVVLTVHATSLTRRHGEGAAIYFLYDEGIPVPRWGYALGLHRISWEAQRRWGKRCTVLDRLDKETLRAALAHGKVLILATHGADGYACTYYAPEKLGVGPPEIGTTNDGRSNRFLRMGVFKAAEWKAHLAPAEVVTYDRESTVFDHATWFAIVGPKQVKQLK